MAVAKSVTIERLGDGAPGLVSREPRGHVGMEQPRNVLRGSEPGLQAGGCEADPFGERRIVERVLGQHCTLEQRVLLMQGLLPLAAFRLGKMFEAVQEEIVAEGRIAGEELVGAFARNDDLVVSVPDVSTHQELGDRERVVDRALRMPERLLEVVVEMRRIQAQHVLVGPDGFCHLARDRRLVIGLVVEADREGLDGRLLRRRGETQDRA